MSRPRGFFPFVFALIFPFLPAGSLRADETLISVHEPAENTRSPNENTRSLNESLNAATDARLFELVNRVLKFTHLPENPFQIQITDDESIETPTANATGYLKIKGVIVNPEKNGVVDHIETERLIVFNQAYLVDLLNATEQDRKKTPWRLIALVAHEIGHFVGRHHETQMDRKTKEAQADWVAGYLLARMGATNEETTEWLDGEPAEASKYYPGKTERETAMLRGWQQGKDNPKAFAIADLMDKGLGNHKEQFNNYNGLDIRGEDICIAKGRMSRQACANVCLNLEGCQAFSYDRWSGYCYPKRAAVLASLEANSTLSVRKKLGKPPVSADEIKMKKMSGFAFPYFESDRAGRPYKKGVQVASADDCDAQCKGDDWCTAYSVSQREFAGDAAEEGIAAPAAFSCSLFRVPPRPIESSRIGEAVGFKLQEAALVSSTNPPDCDK